MDKLIEKLREIETLTTADFIVLCSAIAELERTYHVDLSGLEERRGTKSLEYIKLKMKR